MEINNQTTTDSDPLAAWRLDPSINRPAAGFFWSLVSVFNFIVNTFLCVYTMIYWLKRRNRTTIPTYTSQSSLLFFFLCFIFAAESVVAFPFIILVASSGEWLTYQPIEAKQITCTIIGVILNIIYSTGLETLAVMSIERFLFVSKPHIHKKFTNKVVLIIMGVVLAFSTFTGLIPFFGLGGYQFNSRAGICIPPLNTEGGMIWLTLFIVFSTLPIIVLIVMVTATFIFARRFARRLSTRTQDQSNVEREKDSSDRKNRCCCLCCQENCIKVYGAFVTLIVIYSIKLMCGTATSIVALVAGPEFQPAPLQVASTFLVLTLPGISGVVQIYFRPEFRQLFNWSYLRLRRNKELSQPWDS